MVFGDFMKSKIIRQKNRLLGHITQHYSHFTLEAKVYVSCKKFNDEDLNGLNLDEIETLTLVEPIIKRLHYYAII
jgi:hypothetical protein